MKNFDKIVENMNLYELRLLQKAINMRWSDIQADAVDQFRCGDKVQFKAAKKGGRVVVGDVEKINRKTVVVRSSTGLWKVSPTMISKVA